MQGFTRLDKPKLNDAFVRTNHDGARDEAIVTCVTTWPSGAWRATLTTESGWEYLSNAQEMRLESEWRPVGWELDATTRTYRPPGVRWDEETEAFVAVPVPAATDEKPEEVEGPPPPRTRGPSVRPPAPA